MICLVRYLYWESSGKHLSCKKCPFKDNCDDDTKEGDA